MKRGETITYDTSVKLGRGHYTSSREVKTIEDPRKAEFHMLKFNKPEDWVTHHILPGETIAITGSFGWQNKIWYSLRKEEGQKAMAINSQNLIGATITRK